MQKIFAISGSTRKKSSSKALLRYVAEQFSNLIELELFNDLDQLPHFNPDLDGDNPPQAIIDFRTKIEAADGIIVCTPEYVFSLPGSLKNAIEWLVSTTLLSEKPVALIVAAASGQKAFEALNLIMTTLEVLVEPESKLLIQGVKGKINDLGQLTDQPTKEEVKKTIQSLLNSIK
ncbi:NAD(P)H-dependent FMN reductase [Reichenbachiella faecimaris]|uniref:NAD(P)H-dependent FMN reductase n=1 Tax=Reichenbachiella faecimaris TaxID=692418 RepID=A0A1W2GBU1_REIFA|nr:NAD(P)H-dependent oxidoreductase [Reichenbachiella faecimaris]SMD34071.1 NAD(P)H-dependent FMN reductase [Reichenbachiella faecimaris]